ncbi:MAG: class A beta-lactamase-related serine hydrolase [Candidatus Nomurabacteria bacterium]|nr:class A beta-lactamase-related serine hydrolase [Candidatus Nomurabacteria bacterium]
MFPEDKNRSEKFNKLLTENGFTKSEIGIAIIDLNQPEIKIFGYNVEHFIYPASIYKIFIGAEVLRRIEIGEFSFEQIVEIKSPNDVDKDARIFPGDSRGLLKSGDKVSIDYLLDLMLTRSDNTASNVLIDLVGRENITKNIIHRYNWQGSEVTRKFLDRIKEDKPYRYSETTMTCARHVAEFFYLVEKEELISIFVSKKLKEYMLRWSKEGRKGLAIKDYVSYYRKGGYLENNLYLPLYSSYYKKAGFALDYAAKGIFQLLKTLLIKGWAFIRWVNDAGVVKGKKSYYIVSFFSVNKQINPYKKFRTEKLAKLIYDFMEDLK